MSRYPSNAASSSVSRECSFIPSTWEQQAARTAFWTQQIRVRTILSAWWSSRTNAKEVLREPFRQIPTPEIVEAVVIDMSYLYRNLIKEFLSSAAIIIDPWHVFR